MSIGNVTLPLRGKNFYTSTILMGLIFFGLIFYFRITLADFSIPFISLFLGVVIISLISRRFEAFILLLLIITSTVFGIWEFPTVPIIVGDLYITDLLIIILLVGRLLKSLTRKVVLIPKPLGVPILAFILVAFITFIHSVLFSNISAARAGTDLRVFVHLSLFFLLYYHVRSHRQLKTLLLGFGIIACILAVMQLVQWIVGYENNILGCRLEVLSTAGREYQNVARVMLQGTPIIFFNLSAILSIYVLTKLPHKTKFLLVVLIILLTVGMVATFSRALWIAVLLSSLIILFSARQRITTYPRIIMLVAGTSLIIMLFLQSHMSNAFQIKDAIFTRTMSIINMRKNIQDDTLLIRLIEFRYAWEKITNNPLLGIGFGSSYRPNIFGNVNYERNTSGTFVHSGYLAIQLKMGLLGTIVFIWMMSTFFRRFRRCWKKVKDPLYQAVILGIAASFVGILVFCITSPAPIMYVYWVSVIAVGFGIVEKIFQLEGIK